MPDPISSLSPNTPNTCGNDDSEPSSSVSTASAVTTCEPPAPAAPTQTLNAPSEPAICAVPSLVAKFTPAPPTTVISESTLSTHSGPVAGSASYRHEASIKHIHVAGGTFDGSDAQLGAVSFQHGEDLDIQATGMRRTLAANHNGWGASVTVDLLAAQIHNGIHADDGSYGGHIGGTAELVGVETTIATPVASITYGNSLSFGVSGSMGVRPVGNDGNVELCGKFSIPAYTAGACVEKFW